MTGGAAPRPVANSARLFRAEEDRRAVFFTEAVEPSAVPVYGERVTYRDRRALRRFDPFRSKLAAALARGYEGPLPRPGEAWLYLGAASGSTASHVADLTGPTGAVYAVERSLRPFAKLVHLADRLPTLLPILGDARAPDEYAGDLPGIAGIYADIAQPDQPAILRENARRFLRAGGVALLALKTASMGRAGTPRRYAESASEELESGGLEVEESLGLEPFHKGHWFLAGRATRDLIRAEASERGATPRSARPAGSRR